MNDTAPDPRFTRVELLIGPENAGKLHAATVAVAGLGAVGSFAVEALARSGVGHLLLYDFDTIHHSNFNRQLYALESTAGQQKSGVAAQRVRDISPSCSVEAIQLFIDEDTAPQIASRKPDVVIDAIDSVNPKATLIRTMVKAGIPVISAMGAATRTDPSLVAVADLADTHGCPLARMMRKRLRKHDITTGVRCVYSTETPRTAMTDERLAADEERTIERGRPRPPLGSLAPIPGIVGLIAAREAMDIILANTL
jgi:tRNA A37 threonylcarbamoyladenosine dehydratase